MAKRRERVRAMGCCGWCFGKKVQAALCLFVASTIYLCLEASGTTSATDNEANPSTLQAGVTVSAAKSPPQEASGNSRTVHMAAMFAYLFGPMLLLQNQIDETVVVLNASCFWLLILPRLDPVWAP